MSKEQLETVSLSKNEFDSSEGKYPSRFFYRNALGDYVFIITRSEKKAREYLKEYCGSLYNLRKIGLDSDSGDRTVKCSVSNLSLKGQRAAAIYAKQGVF